jgi:26S proteasome regulatory subunit N2
MFQRCADDGEYEQAIGIALESRRLDIIESTILKGNPSQLLAYVLDVSMTLVQNLEFRNEVLRLLVNLYKKLEKPDYISISQCLVHLNDTTSCANMLKSLIEKNDEVKEEIDLKDIS